MKKKKPAPTLPDGTPVKMGYVNPDELRFGAVEAWADRNDVLAESECEDHDDLAEFTPDVEQQQNNNCTNAAVSSLGEAMYRAAGVEAVPRFSWAFNYAQCNGGRDQGAMCRDVALTFLKGGLCPVDLWPDSKIRASTIPPKVAEAASQWVALEAYQCLDWADVRSALARRFFVYFGTCLGRQAFFNTGPDGKVPPFDGGRTNGHAMWLRGLTRRFGDLRAIDVNSWGTSFGDRGLCYIDRSYFWGQSGNFVNLDAYAFRGIRRKDDDLPVANP